MATGIPLTLPDTISRAILHSEQKRVGIFIGLSGLFLCMGLFNYYITGNNEYRSLFHPATYPVLFAGLTLLFGYEVVVLLYLRRLAAGNGSLAYWAKFWNSTIECLLVAVLLLLICYLEQSAAYLDAPIVFLYFILIFLSALHLDFRFSLYTGILAGAVYLIIALWVINSFPDTSRLPETFYFSRSLLLAGAGLCAGGVAGEIKRNLQHAFNLELEKKEMEQLFGQQVSREVVETLLSSGQSCRLTQASIMFVDVRNFSSFAQQRSPAEIIAFQNELFCPLIDIVNAQGGIVHQIMGDGFMAVFGTPVWYVDHCSKALQAGLQIIEKVKELSDSQTIPQTRMGIGIHTGEIVTGNIGNSLRKQFSVSGTPVIIAARLEQLNKEFQSQFLVSGQFYRSLHAYADAVPIVCERLGCTPVKGIIEKVEVYRIA